MSAEIVYRWRVEPDREQEFFNAALACLTTLSRVDSGRGLLRPRLLQPAIGPSPLTWELRIEVDSMKEVGDLLDKLSMTSVEAQVEPLLSLAGLPGATLLGDAPPLYRVWQRSEE